MAANRFRVVHQGWLQKLLVEAKLLSSIVAGTISIQWSFDTFHNPRVLVMFFERGIEVSLDS